MLEDEGRQYLERYGKGTKGSGWYSFETKGVHFIGLVNVVGSTIAREVDFSAAEERVATTYSQGGRPA